MFKKLVASVTLSPSAIGDLASYAKTLKSRTPYRVAATVLIFATLILEIVIINNPAPTTLPKARTPSNVVVTKNINGLKYSLDARNISQGNADATKKPAQSADQIIYTLSVKNTSNEPKDAQITIDLQDVFDYSSLLGNNDASLDGTLMAWPKVTLQPGEDQVRTFTIKMAKDISTAPTNGLAYDCKMTTAFGSVHHSVVRCSTVKTIQTGVEALPKFNTSTSITILTVAFITSLLLLIRNMQLRREIKIIRNQLTEGNL